MRGVRGSDVGLLLIRGMVGFVFVFHGSQKLFGAFGGPGLAGFAQGLAAMGLPAPGVQSVLAASAEFFGGLALLAGVGTRLAAAPLVVTMLVASFVAHGKAFDIQKGGMEYPLTLALILVGLALTGPGTLTAASALRRARVQEPGVPAPAAEGGRS